MPEKLNTNKFDHLIKHLMPNAEIVDKVEQQLYLNGFLSARAMQKGIYFFVDGLREPTVKIEGINDKFHLIARAICLINIKEETLCHIAEFNISSLISSLSFFNGRKASTLYGVPNEPKTDKKWSILKENFITHQLMEKVIIVESSDKPNQLNWRFGTEADLTGLNDGKLSNKLKEYLSNQNL